MLCVSVIGHFGEHRLVVGGRKKGTKDLGPLTSQAAGHHTVSPLILDLYTNKTQLLTMVQDMSYSTVST